MDETEGTTKSIFLATGDETMVHQWLRKTAPGDLGLGCALLVEVITERKNVRMLSVLVCRSACRCECKPSWAWVRAWVRYRLWARWELELVLCRTSWHLG